MNIKTKNELEFGNPVKIETNWKLTPTQLKYIRIATVTGSGL